MGLLRAVSIGLAVAGSIATVASCNREKPSDPPPAIPRASAAATTVSASPSAAPGLANSVGVANPGTTSQLVEGFWEIEDNSWRWTKKRFAVNVMVPVSAKTSGGKLVFRFAIPDPAFAKYGTQTLHARVGTVELPAQKFDRAGRHELTLDVPAQALQTDTVRIDFSLEKTMTTGGADTRELGVIAESVALTGK